MRTFKAQPPTDMPADTVCVVLQVPNSPTWLSALWWILDQYNYWYNWQETSDKRGKLVAWRWRNMFWQARLENASGQDCEQLTVKGLGIELGEDISMQIRLSPDNPCIIQMWCIDHWEDWYNPSDCISEGASQGSPGGTLDEDECRTYNITLRGNEQYLLPVPVAAGYTIQISNAQGGWWDGNVSHAWNCPSGLTYALGLCVSAGATSGSSPIPALSIGRLIAKIGSTYYDAYNQTIIVPSGVSSSDMYFQMNDASLADNQGSVSFQVRVCNANLQYEQFSFNTASANHTTPFSTISGASYRIRVVGEVCHNPSDNTDRHDAIHSTGDNWATNLGRVIFGAGPLYYGVLLDGANFPDQAHSTAHDYTFIVTGTGAPFVLRPANNNPFTNCGGSFTITVEQLP